MQEVKITRVKKKKDIKRFVEFPFFLYSNDDRFVPPLINDQIKFFCPDKNPYFDHSEVQLFLAERDDKIVGRLTAHTNKQHNVFHRDRIGFFGFFECINDPEISRALFDRASDWLAERGCDTIRGPMNLSVNDQCALLIDGFATPPCIMMPYNPEYYQDLILDYGFTKSKDLYAYHMVGDTIPERLQRIADMVTRKEGLKICTLSRNKKKMKEDLDTIFTLYRIVWERNWGFVPLTGKEYDHMVHTLLPVVDPDLVFIAYVDEKPVGFSVALPDYNIILKKMKGRVLPWGIFQALYYRNRIRRLRVMLMGVIKEYQRRGIDGLFYYHTTKNGMAKGYNEGEFSWVLEDNKDMNNVALKLGATVYKTYRIFDKRIAQ